MGRKKIGEAAKEIPQAAPVESAKPGRSRKYLPVVQKTKSDAIQKRVESRNTIMDSLIEANRQKFGVSHALSTAEEMDQLIIGIPMPSLAFEYLLMNDVFPLKTLFMIAGKWGSCKTSLALEFFRWVRMAHGFCTFINTEQKFDSDLAYGILQETPETKPFAYLAADSVEQYQDMLTASIKVYKKIPNAIYVPGIFCIDSLASATSADSHEKIDKEGHAQKGFAVHALLNKEYISKLKNDYAHWPLSVVYINHLKETTNSQGITQSHTLGGQAVNYHESFEIHSRIKKKNLDCSKFSGIRLELQCAKNSYGKTGNKIDARFLHTIVDDENGYPRDVHYWDWNWSIVVLLNKIINGESSGDTSLYKARLLERGLRIYGDNLSLDSVTARASLPLLGMGKDDKIPFPELGQKIHESEEVCNLIRDALNIKRRITLTGSMDDQVKDFVESME